MQYKLILSSIVLVFACQQKENSNPSREEIQNSKTTMIKLDSSRREIVINELTKIMHNQPKGVSISGLLMNQEKGTDNISRLVILTDSGSIISIPYLPPLSADEVHKFTREGSEVFIEYTTNDKGDTTVLFFSGNNKQ